jgi:hypothetical protein
MAKATAVTVSIAWRLKVLVLVIPVAAMAFVAVVEYVARPFVPERTPLRLKFVASAVIVGVVVEPKVNGALPDPLKIGAVATVVAETIANVILPTPIILPALSILSTGTVPTI